MSQRNVTPEMYVRVFEQHAEGALVLEDLIQRFARNGYVAGGHEADREMVYRAGQRRVVDFVVSMINRVHGVQDDGSDSDD